MLVWLQHEKNCSTTYLPYMEGKADSKLCCKHTAISCIQNGRKYAKPMMSFPCNNNYSSVSQMILAVGGMGPQLDTGEYSHKWHLDDGGRGLLP